MWKLSFKALGQLVLAAALGLFAGLAQAQPQYEDQFNGSSLGAGWVWRDGYAQQFPSDTANHASYQIASSRLSVAIPGGAEHNQWLLRQAQVTRPYLGSGIYETKVDSSLTGSQQFGLVFENSTNDFMMFMVYATDRVYAYVERFAYANSQQYRTTVFGKDLGRPVPSNGPYHLRVTVADAASPASRTWKFEWSPDGAVWELIVSGVLETNVPGENAGAMQRVGVFAGNHPTGFNAFTAQFDHFRYYSSAANLPLGVPLNVGVRAGSNRVDVSWDAVATAESYIVYAAPVGGQLVQIGVSNGTSYADLTAANGVSYHYAVAAVKGGVAGLQSAPVVAVPHVSALDTLPTQGLALALSASELAYGQGNGSLVTTWPSARGAMMSARITGTARPTLVHGALNGQAVVRFDGVDDHLTLPGGFQDFTAGMSLYIVKRPTVLTNAFKIFALGNGAGQQNIALGRAGQTAGYQFFTTDSGGNFGWFNSSGNLVAGEAALVSVLQDAGSANSASYAQLAKNGTALVGQAVFVPPVTTRSLNYIGKTYWNEGMFQGDIAEIILYNRKLNTTEQAAVRDYIAAKYALSLEGGAPPPLGIPSGLNAVAGNASVALSWGNVSGASGYRVFRSTTSGGPYTQIASPSGTSHADNGLNNGTTYYYVVRAFDANGETANSQQVSATPVAVAPAAPTGVSAVAGNATVTLGWAAVNGVTSYRVYRGTASGGPYTLLASPTNTAHVDSSASNGITYFYVVRSFGNGLESVNSAQVSATPSSQVLNPNPALPPNGLYLSLDAETAALQYGNGATVNAWLDTSGHGRNAVSSGTARPTLVTGAISGKPALRFDGADDHFTLPSGFQDFTAGMSLYVVKRPTVLTNAFKIFALGNGAGLANIALGRAGQTPGYQFFTTDSGGAFGWFNSAGNLVAGETALVSVLQDAGAANSSSYAQLAKNGTTLIGQSVFVPPVTARSLNYIGKTYWNEGMFQGDIAEVILYNRKLNATEQAAVHAYISAKYSLVVEGTAPPPLAVPSGLSASAGSGSVALSWNSVAGATGYRVLRGTTSGGPYTQIASPSGASHADNGLNNGTTYYYVVRAFDANGDTANSPQVAATPMAVAPAAPAGVGAIAGNATVTLSWGAVSGVSSYRVYRGTNAGGPYTLLASPGNTSHVDTSASNGTTYYYVVRSFANGLESANSAVVSATPIPGAPDPNPALPIAGLYLALDAETAALQYANGAAVATWLDASGNARNAVSSGGTRPTLVTNAINGRPALRFDGVDDHLTLPSGFQDFTGGMTLFIVKRPSVLTNAFKMFALGNGAGQQNIALGRAGQTSGYQFFTNNSGGSYGWFDTSGGLVAGQVAMVSVAQEAGAANASSYAELAKNGTALFGQLVYVPPVTTRSLNYIGKTYWNEGMFQGDIAEIVLYNRKLSASEMAAVQSYLAGKYGISIP
jgi:fibronectin type 3 domain-containing protein